MIVNDDKPITKEEALKYDKSSLEIDVSRRKKNIQLFQDQIKLEEKEIEKLWKIIAIIDVYKN